MSQLFGIPPKNRINLIRGSQGVPVVENATAVVTIQAAGAGTMTYSIVSGLDGALFSINSSTGVLRFIAAPDYETPLDANADNVYEVIVKAVNDGTPVLEDTRTLLVTVTDVALDVDVVVNGAFASDTGWTKGAGWTIAAGVATAVLADTAISQTTVVSGHTYNVTYTITRTAGSVLVTCGTAAGTVRSSAGTYSDSIVADGTTLAFTGTGFSGTLDNVTAVG